MFIQVIQGQATNPDALRAELHIYREGGSDQAGFVQVIQGYSPDMERLAALGRAREQTMAEQLRTSLA